MLITACTKLSTPAMATHLEMIRKVSERAHLGYQHEPGKKKLLESPGYQVNIISFTKKLKDKGENT